MFKDSTCQFYRKCKLVKECSGCEIPQAAEEYEREFEAKLSYTEDPDRRGEMQSSDVFFGLAKNRGSIDWVPMGAEEEAAQTAEGEEGE